VIPLTQCSTNELEESANNRIEWSKFRINTGLKTLSWNEYKTREGINLKGTTGTGYADCSVVTNDLGAYHSHGFALGRIHFTGHNAGTRGLIDVPDSANPGSFSGILISPKPHRGPLARYLTSFAIFIKLHANVLRAPEASTTASWAASASN